MTRFLFCKEGSAVWISHLDLQRMFQRAFNRAGIAVALTMESQCEILDCHLADEAITPREAAERLNQAGFPEGIRILEGYASDRKLREIGALQARLLLEYDRGVPEGAVPRIETLLTGPSLIVPKHSKKKGMVDTDIRPMIFALAVSQPDAGHVEILTTVQAGEPSLNPELLLRAVERELPGDAPDAARIRRLEILDQSGGVFR